MIRQLYFVNQKDIQNATQSSPLVSPEPNDSNVNNGPVDASEQPFVETRQHTNENSGPSRTEEMLKDYSSALNANEAMSAMSSMVVGLLANKDASTSSSNSPSNQKSNFDFDSATYGNTTPLTSTNVEQTFHRQVDTSKGIAFAEDLPKLDYLSTSLRKQILEGNDINLSLLLYPKNEVPQTRSVFSEWLTVELSTPRDPRLEKRLTLDEFNKAFRKLRNIICKVYPQRRDELDRY
ncbi:unnamed protein product [Mytilus coruscus]|uniref:Uncharacterized protein n=1 Tax=Mytilus coruscus TaxID=42192 RepID=A0A6J8AQ85_MYTCO|nr:unnamed protein product [Mytilus coruscus]